MLNSFKSSNSIENANNQYLRATDDYTSILNPSSSVNLNNAQKIAVVYACINIKMKALSVIPIKVYRKNGLDKIEDKSNPLYEILRYEPNKDLTASTYKKIVSQDLDITGNHYSQIIRNGLGQVTAMYPLQASKMSVRFESTGSRKKIYEYGGVVVNPNRILHIYDIPDSENLKGISPIEYAKNALEFASNTSQHGNQLFKNGSMPSGVFEHPSELEDEAFKRLKQDLTSKYSGLKNLGKPMLLEGGLTFKPMTLKNSDAEWLASRKFNREEIASIFGVPVAMLNDSENTSYGNLEQKYLEFKDNTIYPLTTNIEERIRQKLLTPVQKEVISIKFEYNNLMRVDAKTRVEYFKSRFDTASISPNEIRRYESENGFKGGDEYYYQSNNLTPVGQKPNNGDNND